MALPQPVAEAAAAKGLTRDQEGMEVNWKVIIDLYGSEEEAVAAVRRNAMILAPMYASPSTLKESFDALLTAMGNEEEAMEIMRMNPAVLTCGPGLANADVAEIRNFAKFRSVVDQIPPSAIWAVLLSIGGLIIFRIASVQLGL